MSKNNRKEIIKQQADRKERFAMRKVKQGVASVLVGASILGVGVGLIQGVASSDNNLVIEAAETGAQIVAFDHYVLEGQPYNFSQNVNAFEIVDGEMIDLTSEVEIIGSTVLGSNKQLIEYSVVGSDGVAKTTTATITYGKDYATALESVQKAAAQLEAEVGRLGDEAAGIQGQFTDIAAQLAALRTEYDAYVEAAKAQDADIDALAARASAIEKEIADVMSAITHALGDVAELDREMEEQYGFITGEITRLEDELDAFTKSVDDRVAAMQAELPEKATQEEVDALQARVDAFLADTNGIADGINARLDTLNALYEDVVNGSKERDEAMLDMIGLQEDRVDELRDQLGTVLKDSEAEIARLQKELEGKADPAEVEALEAELAALQADREAREAAFNTQIEAAEAANKALADRIDGYEGIITELENQLLKMEEELAVLERILEAIELGADKVEIITPGGDTVEIEDPEDYVEDNLPTDPTQPVEPGDEPDPQDPAEVDPPMDEDAPVTPEPEADVPAEAAPPVDEDVEAAEPVVQPTEPILDEAPAGPDADPVVDELPAPDELDEVAAGEDVTIDYSPDASDAEPFLGEGNDTTDDADASTSSSDDPAADGPSDGGASPRAMSNEPGADPTSGEAEAAADAEVLPQTGAGLGAMFGIGASGLAAVGAGAWKVFRKRK